MKILLLSSYVDPGSGASILIRLANKLKIEGHEVKILTTRQGYDSDIIEAVRMPIGLNLVNRIINKITPNYFSFIYTPLLAAIRKYNPEVINIHWTHGATIPINIIPVLCQKWPVFWTLHDMWPITNNTFFEYTEGRNLLSKDTTHVQKLKHFLKARVRIMPEALFQYKVKTLNNVNLHTISPSRWLRDKVNASPVFSSAINHHVPNGVDTAIFRPLERNMLRVKYGIHEDSKVVLFLASNLADERKGFYYFSKAMFRLKEKRPDLIGNVITLLIGNNSTNADMFLPTDVKNLGSTKDVSSLVEYYNLADVFVSASIADNYPSTMLESTACGTPVVAFDVGGISEIVIDSETGLLVDNKDVEELAESIQKLLIDTELHENMSFKCRDFAVDRLSMDRYVNHYIKLFRDSCMGQHNCHVAKT